MPPEADAAWTFTGHEPQLGYMHYRDLDAGQMLVAVPGGTYHIGAAGHEYEVPPPDGKWAPASSEEGQAAQAAAAHAAEDATSSPPARRKRGDTSAPGGSESTGAGD